MAFTHGKDSYLLIDDHGGTERDLSLYAEEVTGLPGPIDMANITVFGEGDKVYVAGTGGAEFKVSGPWEPTLDLYVGTAFQRKTARTFKYGPAGSTGGYVRITGECYLQNYEVAGGAGDAVRFTLTCRTTDTITVDTF